jgi:Dyp-type peroxidase family
MGASTDRSPHLLPAWDDMQGLVLSAYPHLGCASYLFFTVDNAAAARRWLARIRTRITSAFKPPASRRPHCHVNVAFTATALEALGGRLENFSDAFTEGMHGRIHRTILLGDVGDNDPANWRWGGRAETRVDVLAMVFADAAEPLETEVAGIMPGEGLRLVLRQDALSFSTTGGREHFGFKDGISQPILQGSADAERFPESIHVTALGEFVIGYPNAAGVSIGREDGAKRSIPLPAVGDCPGFGRNGTYLVLRQLQQHVEAFWAEMTERTMVKGRRDADAERRLAEKIVGRSVDGTPLVPYANVDDNEFVYAEDPYGYGCPLGAHVRRANPRDSFENNNLPFEPTNDHRILRRGRSYIYQDEHTGALERGLLFLCLNADIERQFEFIQQNWINNTSFLGLADENDPLIGNRPPAARGAGSTFTLGGLPAPVCVADLPRFVTVRGGGYFFLPGLAALGYLSGHA